MIVCINKKDDEYKFSVNDKNKFTEISPDGKESILLHEVSDEYDGVCTSDGDFHFLIQSITGELIYLKSEQNVWRKYSIFKNKDNECKIKNIKLTFSDNALCAFYTIDHAGKIMLCKHIFGANNLYMTPEIADLTDGRRDFSICTDMTNCTRLYYRDIAGQRQEIVYDKSFMKISQRKRASGGEIYNFSAVNSGKRIDSVYMSVKKSYTALMYSGEDEKKEKIITFGISKNTKPVICAKGDEITIIWQDNKNIFKSVSKDGGESFSKPVAAIKNTEFVRLRRCGFRPGVVYSDWSLRNDFVSEIRTKTMDERRSVMDKSSRYDGQITDRNAKELVMRLEKMQNEIEKIGFGIDRVCDFLARLTEFKKESEKDTLKEIIASSDIGEKNEENIKLFESMTIDEALPENDEIMIASEE